jgi:hypothetical protein
MVRPAGFRFNTETAETNTFQFSDGLSKIEIQKQALAEFDRMVATLQQHGIHVDVFEDSAYPIKPDAVFPNNWISTHENGTIVLYPMLAKNRRLERSKDIISVLKERYTINQVLDLTSNEQTSQFLEGTGSIIFDHLHRKAFACQSMRTNEKLLHSVCRTMGYEPILFDACDENDLPIYHTNVMLSIGTEIAVVCADAISKGRKEVISELKKHREVIEITRKQMSAFVGNVMQLKQKNGRNLVAISKTAITALTNNQIQSLEKSVMLLPIDVSTIEKYGGGSVRCMIAENFLSKKGS